MKFLRHLYFALRNSYCRSVHRNYLVVAEDLRIGSKGSRHFDPSYCVMCDHIVMQVIGQHHIHM